MQTVQRGVLLDDVLGKITPVGTLTVLHVFTGGTDGALPYAPLIQATDGNFYGTTWRGGPSNEGTLFRMSPSGTVTILHTFTNLVDGAAPQDPLIQGTDGNFYGTTTGDGSGPPGFGTVFRMAPSGTVATLHAFTGHDGVYPSASLIQATDGNFYGTTPSGGASGRGVVFRLSMTVTPQPSDFDGDGKADVTVYRPSAGTWFVLNSSTNHTVEQLSVGQPCRHSRTSRL